MGGIELLPDFSSAESVKMYVLTIILQAFIFLSVFIFLSHYIFKPVIKFITLRNKSISDVENKITEFGQKNVVLSEEFEWRMDGAKQLAVEKREIARIMGRRRADMILSDVKRETNRDTTHVVKSTEKAYNAVEPTMKKKINKFSDEIVEKILT